MTLAMTYPYEMPVYEVTPIVTDHPMNGSGIIGELPSEFSPQESLEYLAILPAAERIAYSNLSTQPIRCMALCDDSGGGRELTREALRSDVEVYITDEAKYDNYLDAQDRLWLTTLGYFESEHCTHTILYDALSDKYRGFAIHISDVDTNPTHYF